MYQMMRTFGTGLKLSKSFENSFFFARCSGVTDKKCSIYIYIMMMMMRPNYAKRVCELCTEIKGVEAFSKRPRKCYRVGSERLYIR